MTIFGGDALVASDTKYTPAELLKLYGVSIAWLIQVTKLGHQSVHRAVYGDGEWKTNVTVAESIAEALGVTIDEVEWPNGLSNLGRPAHTGKPLKASQDTAKLEYCPVHYIQLPVSGVCDMCA